MTLSTNIIAMDPIDPERAFMHMAKLLGAGEGYRWEVRDEFLAGNPAIIAEIGQGLPAWLIVSHNNGELLNLQDYYTSDRNDPRLKVLDADGESDFAFHPQGYADIDIDTAYGYGRGEDIGGCGDLHAWLVREYARWLDAQSVRWYWRNEFTGEWFGTLDQLHELGDAELGGKNPDLRHLTAEGA